MSNQTTVREFILLGLTDHRGLEILIFLLLLSIYLLTIIGNVAIITITLVDHHLCTPMYFFLRHVAFLDIGYTTTIIPKALANMALGKRTISLHGCFMQLFLYFGLGTTVFFLLAVMAFDRYLAICKPLHYSSIMNGQICSLLVLCCWIGGFLVILGPTMPLFQMPFCGPNIIDHFFCDNGPLIKLVCADTALLELTDSLTGTLSLIGTLVVNLVSYIHIISSVMRIPSTTGRQKAFSTFSSHITVVSITYGSCIFLYVKPKETGKLEFGKLVAVLNTIISPLLVPFVYCLRNKQVKDALRGAFRQGVAFCRNSK
ncbi:olfactory receptor 49-like [Eublepharis macularius]|uniref:Olfactory receptor 49-like n=1 Tax=Eublepharis macularius TaxID=481883 RepID=A0AA97LBX4_EUBMA|nr:olfactory receptor 49-like [Eublepharis macularius]